MDRKTDRDAQNRRTNLKTIGIISGVVGGIVGAVVANSVVRQMFQPSVDDRLVAITNEFNKTLPLTVDEITRLDATAPLPGQKLMYKYTITTADPIPPRDKLVAAIRPLQVNNYKTSGDMAELRAMGVTLVYAYFDPQGKEVARFEVSPSDFQ